MSPTPESLRGNWNYPTSIRFGVGRIKELPEACKSLGMTKPLLITDPGLAKLPMIQNALKLNQEAGLPTGLFSDIKPNPVGRNVEDGIAAYRKGRHDGVIAFGGGSGLDAAKTVAFMVGQTLPIWHFDDNGPGWKDASLAGIAPIVAVPTTAGTGSEVGRATVILNEATHTKVILFHPKMQPSIVIEDAELTVGLPPHVTAATGMDALAHCLEAYCAPGHHPMADGIAIEGIRLIKEYLPQAFADGKDLVARSQMMIAASMGATAFQKGLGAVHSISHPVGALYDTHHGLTNAVMMPYVLAFNRSAIEERMARLAAYLGLPNPSFQSVMDWLLAFRRQLKIPHTLKELGVGPERADEIAKMAEADPSTGSNPVKAGAAEMKKMFLDAVEGRLP
ncbi:MAG: iron-containing alcohol dehydrogenase [Alphaproteobacteria bacterium]|nr:iron-containing alcohol dehydrogenase [Alphaproteobacteria bacterium]